MKPVNLKHVRLTDGFFKAAEDRNDSVTIPAVYRRFCETGRFEALKCKETERRSHIFWDSDVAKWLEAVAVRLYKTPDPALRAAFDEAVDDVVRNALPCGYFNSYFQVYEKDAIFTRRSDHELYCAGHLFEAAAAAKEYLDDDRLLSFSSRYADYIRERFVVRRDTGFTTPGHEEIELALLRLFRLTGDRKYYDLAAFFLNERGKEQGDQRDLAYNQSHLPVREQSEAVGHAVRAGYLYTAMAEFAELSGDEAMLSTAKRLYDDVVNRKMSVSGSMGNLHSGEQFSAAYDLENYTSYNETCAAVALVLFSDRMLRLTGDSACGDVIERAVYNGILSGLSLSGEEFFYVNPLEMQLSRKNYAEQLPHAYGDFAPLSRRVNLFFCSCCPPNLCRFFEEFPQYLYYEDEKENVLLVSQYASSDLQCSFGTLRLSTRLPYDGKTEIEIDPVRPFTLKLRVPAWCDAYDDQKKDGYLVRYVDKKQTVSLDFRPRFRKIYARPAVWEDRGKVALSYGPLLLAMEGAGNDFPVSSVVIGSIEGATVTKAFPGKSAEVPPQKIGAKPPAGNAPGQDQAPSSDFPAYSFRIPVLVKEENRPLYSYAPAKRTPRTATFVPYFAWANREESDMAVFFPEEPR